MTFNEVLKIFTDIADVHLQIKGNYGIGQEHEINGALETTRTYPMLWIIPIDSITREQTKERTFELLCFDLVHKDESNENEVLSDTEQILDDFIKKVQNDSDDYLIVGDPQMFPYTEKYQDDVSGWRTLITVETAHYIHQACDVPVE